MRALVTGGGGFLGGALARRLRERGDDVRVFGRGSYPELEAIGIDSYRGDLTDYEAVRAACDDRDTVFHAGAKVGLWGRPEDFEAVNVQGTRNVLRACLELGARKLVFTGSPSVVFDGRDVEGVDESAPTPARFDCDYSRTKARAEEMVLAANHERLCTVSLRPHLVWGPGDRHLLPRLVSRARSGRLLRIGAENKRVDTLYIDDAVEAHILAAVQLSPLSELAGKAYFLSAGDPRPVWEIIERMLAAAGLGPVERRVPKGFALAAAGACEAVWRVLGLSSEPPVTRFLVGQLTTAHWFDISAAKRDLGWSPRVKLEDGMARLAQWIRSSRGR
ncbi:MAG TPA: 3-beta hydroxysteroid dehydrogenase [Elusimicrobia bacterium]|nr:MAG: 3-beta hydroxysteroid dehydrogenase [Elusimicrobia bacterium GWA2_66_18]OGR72924.1 MAG: 3-beta hydroxysteroid dehydrogenase [Elusimicrobia bacterium GWC2_65_9]HAZ08299.1 3-beta hydroxysteroid dehydrogenase [Elusimicrobiota bacterium]